MRMILVVLAFILAHPAVAQERDSVFASYGDYETFVDSKIMSRDFVPLILALGGRDEYSAEQLTSVNGQLLAAFQADFDNKTVFKREDMGGGVSREARLYWTGDSYAFFYAILHQRAEDVIVLNFHLNSSVSKVMDKF